MDGYLGLFLVVALVAVAYWGLVFVVDLLQRKFGKPRESWIPRATGAQGGHGKEDAPVSFGDSGGSYDSGGTASSGGGSWGGEGGSFGGGGASSSW